MPGVFDREGDMGWTFFVPKTAIEPLGGVDFILDWEGERGLRWTFFIPNFATGGAGWVWCSSWIGRGRGDWAERWEGLVVIVSWDGERSWECALAGVESHLRI